MASVVKDKNGHRRILFVAPDGRRPTVRLGKVSQRTAEGVKYRVEQLLEALRFNRAMEADVAQWVMELEPWLAKKLAAVGLIPELQPKPQAALKAFVDDYIDRRQDVSRHTRRIWRQTLARLGEAFGEARPLDEISRGDAEDWRLSMVAAKLADASVRKHCGFAKHFFAQAVKRELIATNPFAELVSSPVGNAARQYFVSREETNAILEKAPDAEWRLIIALSRYGGLRCPSEHLALTWQDVDWAKNRITVRSTKTAKHKGHESRLVPLFPELRPYLEESYELAGADPFVIQRQRGEDANFRTRLKKIVERAGLKPWPRITHNLRASRATELAAEHPAHVAAAWLGHSTLVAQKHYWTVTEDDFERASKSGAQSGVRDAETAQNPAQQARAGNSSESQVDHASLCTTGTSAASCNSSRHSAKKMAEVHGNRTHQPRVIPGAQRF